MLDLGASDLHLTAGAPPTVRVAGNLRPLNGAPRMDPASLQRVLYAMLTQEQRENFEQHSNSTSPTRCQGVPGSA